MPREARPACQLRQLAAANSLSTSLKLRQQAGQLALLQFGEAGCHTLLEGADFLTRRKEQRLTGAVKEQRVAAPVAQEESRA